MGAATRAPSRIISRFGLTFWLAVGGLALGAVVSLLLIKPTPHKQRASLSINGVA